MAATVMGTWRHHGSKSTFAISRSQKFVQGPNCFAGGISDGTRFGATTSVEEKVDIRRANDDYNKYHVCGGTTLQTALHKHKTDMIKFVETSLIIK